MLNFSFKNIRARMTETITVPAPKITAATPSPEDRANR